MAVTHVTEQNYQSEVLKSQKPVVIDFWAPWCGPCRMMGPVFEQISDELTDAKFVKVNVDEEMLLSGSFGIQGIPALVIMKQGKETGRIVGFAPKDVLKQKIQAAVRSAA